MRQTPSSENQEPMQKTGWAGTFASLSYKNFRLLWFGTIFMSGGTWIQQITLGWLAFEMTKSPLQVSIVLGLRAIPMLAAPIAGVIADIFDRRKFLLLDQTYLALLAFCFSFVIIFNWHEIWHLYLFSLLTGAGWGMMNPLRQTLVANSVPRAALTNAIALNSMAFNSMRMIGPGIAGIMIAIFGPEVNFLLQAAMYGAVVFLVIPYKAEFAEPRKKVTNITPIKDLKEGLVYVASQPIPRYSILLSLVATVCLMAFIQTQLPVFVAVDLHDPDGGLLGLMGLGMGVGGFLGAIFVARFHFIKSKGKVALIAVAFGAISLVLLSYVNSWQLAWIILVIQQLFFIMVMTTNNTILQSVTPDHLRGRVMGIFMLDVGMQPIGGVVAGLLATYYGVSVAWAVGGFMGIILVALIALIAPSFRKLQI
ncbi:MAG: hypothetical protein CL763_01780 [Chloroflexi bacterium]|nr:hypothetical protein [Chloroflexota bacterium]|tara:strand:+ start:878 stop:2146 length:1269 start_codon:yes stop_codon:yes gene_type:complete